MRIPVFFLAVLVIACSQSCSKGSDVPDPDPIPVIKPDTLGTGWSKKTIPAETNLADIVFNSSTNGYVAGNKIYQSTDGGNSWVPVFNTSMANIAMTNDNKGFFVGQQTAIYKTIDAAISFQSSPITAVPTDIFFTDNNNGFCITQNGLFNTTDGGLNWPKITTTGLPNVQDYYSLSFINNTTGFVVNSSGIYRSVGSLATWQPASISGGSGVTGFGSIFALSASNIYAASYNAHIFKSTNGGANFSFVKKLDSESFTDLHFFNDLEGYASAGRNVFKTTDGGLNWSKVVSLGQGNLSELHFTDTNHGWACGDSTVLIFKQ